MSYEIMMYSHMRVCVCVCRTVCAPEGDSYCRMMSRLLAAHAIV